MGRVCSQAGQLVAFEVPLVYPTIGKVFIFSSAQSEAHMPSAYFRFSSWALSSNSFWRRCRFCPWEFWKWGTTFPPTNCEEWKGPTVLRLTTRIFWFLGQGDWTTSLYKTFHFCRSNSTEGFPTSCCPCFYPSGKRTLKFVHPLLGSSFQPNW